MSLRNTIPVNFAAGFVCVCHSGLMNGLADDGWDALSPEDRTGLCVLRAGDGSAEAKRPGRGLFLLSGSSLDLYRKVGGCRTYLGGKTDFISNGI